MSGSTAELPRAFPTCQCSGDLRDEVVHEGKVVVGSRYTAGRLRQDEHRRAGLLRYDTRQVLWIERFLDEQRTVLRLHQRDELRQVCPRGPYSAFPFLGADHLPPA